MKLKLNGIIFLTVLVSLLFTAQKSVAQCFQIESILVDACGPTEGLNEMVRFKVGSAAINTSNLSVVWATTANNWSGVIKNSTTAARVAALNADILAAGGCGQLVEPTAGVLPANATVILVTSYNLDTTLNSFGALTENIYIIFHNNPDNISGNFANFGSGIRTLVMNFGSCSDTVSYDRSLLVDQSGTIGSEDGATVEYTPAGVATYVNYGCSAPVPPFTVNAGLPAMSACAGTTISLTGTAIGQQSVSWSAPSGTFSASSNLGTNFTIPNNASGQTITLTLTATNTCGTIITDTIILTVTASTVPTFSLPSALCTGATAPALPLTSTNGVTGAWNPVAISNTATGTYIFTPNTGQCASSFTLNVTVSTSILPTFAVPTTLCIGATAPTLPTTATNGIVGTWNPSTINNTANGTYVFTPNAGQCATTFTLIVTVTNSITPTFSIPTTLCSGTAAPLLPIASTNGIVGTWNPSVINSTVNGTYIFTPNAGQCAAPLTLIVTVTNLATPTFSIANTLCSGSTAPLLPIASTNGILGTWNPSVINNTANGTYVFTPNAGQCAAPLTLIVTVTNSITPTFSISNSFCTGSIAPVLPTTSINGIVGVWNPATINNTTSGAYVFTPTAGQCASLFTLNVTVTNSITPAFSIANTLCSGSAAPTLPATSSNGIAGTWNPAAINNTANGTYIFTPNSGQCATSFTLDVTVTSFEIQSAQNCENGAYIVTVSPLNNSFNPDTVTYLWKNSLGNVVGMNENILNVTQLMNSSTIVFPATFEVTVSDSNGCSSKLNVTVNGAFCKIPKGISPNNDGDNDSFDLTGLGVDEIFIYNRYGTEVFHKRNYTDEWNGTSDKGHELPAATYFYVLRKNNNETLSGWVYVIR
ncbi:gliding motility-associated C-terminal domain-containing protein [Flavobacterium sp. SM2513]|uniref:T9SS type B sorting domain-containing protein n=1 Tax=Flavobacterium sp. SM2513 TaxID=3424766 RepID=UPI003D7F271D